MPVTGDFAALKRLMDRVGPPGVRALTPRVAQRMAATADKLLGDEFHQSRDPYGNPWQPLAYRRGKPLEKTGRMSRSRTAQADGATVKVTIWTTYAIYHQKGTQPHQRAGGAIPQSRRGRFISKRKAAQAKASSQKVAIFGAYQHGGIPRRQMLPEASTGGLGPIWSAAFEKDANDVVREALGG